MSSFTCVQCLSSMSNQQSKGVAVYSQLLGWVLQVPLSPFHTISSLAGGLCVPFQIPKAHAPGYSWIGVP